MRLLATISNKCFPVKVLRNISFFNRGTKVIKKLIKPAFKMKGCIKLLAAGLKYCFSYYYFPHQLFSEISVGEFLNVLW